MTNLIENQKCLEYMSFLHGDSIDDKRFKKTYVFLGVKSPNKNFRPFSVRVEEILNGEYLKNFKFNPSCDYYVTSNTFRKYKGKSREMLFSLENIIIDIDNHSSVVNDTQIQRVIEVVTSKADFKPTAVNKTGRGVQFVYRIEKVSYKLESFFRNIADCLIENIESIISQDPTLKDFSVDVGASKNTAGFFRLAGTINTKVARLSSFEICGRKYKHQEFVDYYNLNEKFRSKTKKISSHKKTKTSTYTPKNTDTYNKSKSVSKKKTSSLFETRLKWVQECIDSNQNRNLNDGFRDNCLFLAGNCYYFQNRNTFQERLEKLNNSLGTPLDSKQVDSIVRAIETAHGYRYSNETFLKVLGFSHDEIKQKFTRNNKRAKGHENREKIKKRNEQIIKDFLAEVDSNPNNLTEILADKYNLSHSQINRIVKDARKQYKLEKSKRVKEGRASGQTLLEISINESRSVSTIHRLAKEPSPVISPVDNIDNTKSNEVEVTVNYQYEDFQKTHNCSVCFVWKGIRLGEPNSLGWIVEKLGDGFSLGDIWYTFKLDDKSNTSGETYASGSGISTEISSNYKDCKYSYDFEYEFDLIDSSDSENFDSDSEGNATINVKVNGIFNSSTIPFDMQCLNHVNNFICAFNASKGNEDYKPLHRFLNSMDINVLKVIYSFFANQVMTNYMTRISGTVYLSVNKLYYLCLPLNYDDDNNSGNMYADKSVAKFKSIKNVKEAMIGMMNIDNIFKNPEFCYNKYFKDFVSQRIRQLDQLRGCLRKLAYLHLICLIDDPKASGYGCMCIAPTVLDIDSANLSASFWYDMGYTSRFICYDEYLEARGLDYLKLVVSRKSKNDNPYLEDSIREFVGDAKYCPLSQFPKNCRDFIEIRLKHIFGEQYQIMKIKNNAMLGRFEELGISGEGIKVGVKILLHRDYVPEINLLEFLD